METFLNSRVIGQEHVFKAICPYIRIGEKGLSAENELRGAFLFTGPTGTGKTETAKALAEYLEIPLLRFDMSEYEDSDKWLHDFSFKLENQTHGIILLDEIEKGSLKIMDYFLQILSEAKITIDRKEINLHEFYVIMTSNIGSRNIMGESNFTIARNIVDQMIQKQFRPEFLGRFYRDCIICFKPLDYWHMKQIAEQKIKMEIDRLNGLGYDLKYDDSVVPFFAGRMSRDFGARPLVQMVRRFFSLALVNSERKIGTFAEQNGNIVLI